MLDLFSQFNWVFQLCAFALVVLFFSVLALVIQRVFYSNLRASAPPA
uniref:p5 n=1 Tax=Grapevine leafroll-associated virus Carn TaxID=659661 RepID=D2E4A8_9VIRU|nr:p5 [Grapevine leafroll-associated virus Carn]